MDGTNGSSRKRPGPPPVPAHVKYRTRTSRFAERSPQDVKQRPSALLSALVGGTATSPAPPDAPKIVDFLNLEDNTTQTNSAVNVDQPLFQPYPSLLQFVEYAAFGVYEQVSATTTRRPRPLLPPPTTTTTGHDADAGGCCCGCRDAVLPRPRPPLPLPPASTPATATTTTMPDHHPTPTTTDHHRPPPPPTPADSLLPQQ